MKQTLVTFIGAAFAIAIYWLGFVNGVYYNEQVEVESEVKTEETTELSDQDIVEMYISERFGSEYYGGVYKSEIEDEEYVAFRVYDEDGELCFVGQLHREYYSNLYSMR